MLKGHGWWKSISAGCVLMFSVTYSRSVTPLSPSDLLLGSLKHPLHLHISIRVMVRLLCVIRVKNNINNNNKNNGSLWSRSLIMYIKERETLKRAVFSLYTCQGPLWSWSCGVSARVWWCKSRCWVCTVCPQGRKFKFWTQKNPWHW